MVWSDSWTNTVDWRLNVFPPFCSDIRFEIFLNDFMIIYTRIVDAAAFNDEGPPPLTLLSLLPLLLHLLPHRTDTDVFPLIHDKLGKLHETIWLNKPKVVYVDSKRSLKNASRELGSFR